MGYMQAAEMVGHDLRTAISWHLTSNHYPPVPTSMIDPCIEAIDAMIAEDPDEEIDLPEGTLYRGRSSAPAWAIAEAHHLHAWIESATEED